MPENQEELDSILRMKASAYGKEISFKDLLLKVERSHIQETIDTLYETALQEGLAE